MRANRPEPSPLLGEGCRIARGYAKMLEIRGLGRYLFSSHGDAKSRIA
jgi:hypothetical protein